MQVYVFGLDFIPKARVLEERFDGDLIDEVDHAALLGIRVEELEEVNEFPQVQVLFLVLQFLEQRTLDRLVQQFEVVFLEILWLLVSFKALKELQDGGNLDFLHSLQSLQLVHLLIQHQLDQGPEKAVVEVLELKVRKAELQQQILLVELLLWKHDQFIEVIVLGLGLEFLELADEVVQVVLEVFEVRDLVNEHLHEEVLGVRVDVRVEAIEDLLDLLEFLQHVFFPDLDLVLQDHYFLHVFLYRKRRGSVFVIEVLEVGDEPLLGDVFDLSVDLLSQDTQFAAHFVLHLPGHLLDQLQVFEGIGQSCLHFLQLLTQVSGHQVF